jgi:hypothetical protein
MDGWSREKKGDWKGWCRSEERWEGSIPELIE